MYRKYCNLRVVGVNTQSIYVEYFIRTSFFASVYNYETAGVTKVLLLW